VKADMHIHVSKFYPFSLEDMVEKCVREGYDLLIATDHLDNRRHRKLTRNQWSKASLAFVIECRKQGILGLLGAEIGVDRCHYLVYGLSISRLWSCLPVSNSIDLISKVHEFGGLVIQAHPFRPNRYGKWVVDFLVDGYEIWNSHKENHLLMALALVQETGTLFTCGTDSHRFRHLCKARRIFNKEIKSNEDLVAALKEQHLEPLGKNLQKQKMLLFKTFHDETENNGQAKSE